MSPVGCFEPNGYGLFDMVGNVWEMTATVYKGHSPKAQVIKGGSFLCAPNYCRRYRPAARQPQEADLGTSHVGFRTVLTAD
jgi:formylglycine-generating enzyme required for sulfatase activity